MWGVRTQVGGLRLREEEEGRTEKRTRGGTRSGTKTEGEEEAVAELDEEELGKMEGREWTGEVDWMEVEEVVMVVEEVVSVVEEEVRVVEEQVYLEGLV